MKRLAIVAVCLAAAGLVGLISTGEHATASTTVVVKPTSMNGWVFASEGATGSGAFVTGPAGQPAGNGSAELTIDATGREIIATGGYVGTRLDEITALQYSTYEPVATGPFFAMSLQFNVDYDLTDGIFAFQGRLVFEPYLNGTVTHGGWQTWTPLTGVWWATGAPGNGLGFCPQATPCSIATILSNWPDAGIHATLGALLFKAGGPWAPASTYNVDAFTITTIASDTLFDFEPEIPCTTTCYVDAATGDDTFDGYAPASAKKTIQAAVNQLTPGGNVVIAAGTYVENVIVNKTATLTGAGASTIVQPAASNPVCGSGSLCGGTASNVFRIEADDVIIENLTVDGDNPSLTSGVVRAGADLDARNGIIENHLAGIFDNTEVRDVTVQNIYLRGIQTGSGGSGFYIHDNTLINVNGEGASIAIFNFGGSGVIEDNNISDANDAVASNHSRGTQHLNNIITDAGSGVHSDNNGSGGGSADVLDGNDVSNCKVNGFGVWTFAAYLPISVSDNTVTNCAVGLASAGQFTGSSTFTDNVVDGTGLLGSTGVYTTTSLFGFGSSNGDATFTGNVIKDNADGFFIESEPGFTNETIAHLNEISGNSNSGATASGTGVFDADLAANWWGNNTGPAHILNIGGAANSVTDDVVYSPWLGFGDASGTAGFQAASPMTWIANPGVCKVTCIQRAIDFSANGDTVKAKTGIFPEQVTVNKDITLTAASTPIIDGGGSGDVVTITVDGVTLNGFEIRNGTNGVVIAAGADTATVTNNNVHTFTSAGLRATSSTGDNIQLNTITGPHTGSCVGGFWGMRLDSVSATVDQNTISGIGNGVTTGCQEGRAIEAVGAGTLIITDNAISQYQKSGIIIRNTLNVTITGNTTAGEGPTSAIAMNGITTLSSGTNIISGNHTSGHSYIPGTDVSCGILVFNTTATVTGNDSTSDEVGICALGGNGTLVSTNDVIAHTQQGIYIDGAVNILVDDNDIDGQGAGTPGGAGTTPDDDLRYYGVFAVDSTGTINNNDIIGIHHGPNGVQSGVGVRLTARSGAASDMDITNNRINTYQKNGMVITNFYGGTGVNAMINGNTVIGAGPVNYIAQNGIQISAGATATVTLNDVSGHDYTPFTVAAVGVLIIDAGLVTVDDNEIHDNMEGMYVQQTDGAIVTNNIFTANYDASIFVYLSSDGIYHFNTFNGMPGSYGMYIYDVSLDNEIQNNDFLANSYGVVVDYSAGAPLSNHIVVNNFIGNTVFGVQQTGALVGPPVDAEDNWWNACDGPSPVGPGSGDPVSTNVDFTPFEHGGCDTDGDLLTDDAESLIHLTDFTDPDTDGDGCTDGEEVLFPVVLGGVRDPLYFWDFYDVDGTKSIGLSDTLLILSHFGHAATGDVLDNLLDRFIPNVAQGWLSAEANNGVGLADALANLRSFGDSCSGLPN